MAAGRWPGTTFCSAEPAASAAAEVVVITIIRGRMVLAGKVLLARSGFRSGTEQLGLGSSEFVVGQNALLMQRRKLVQLVNHG
jgi:hypothetical protein